MQLGLPAKEAIEMHKERCVFCDSEMAVSAMRDTWWYENDFHVARCRTQGCVGSYRVQHTLFQTRIEEKRRQGLHAKALVYVAQGLQPVLYHNGERTVLTTLDQSGALIRPELVRTN